MKKTVIALSIVFALAIVAAVAAPVLASTSGTTTINGAITGGTAGTIELNAPGNFVLTSPGQSAGVMYPEIPAVGNSANGLIKANVNWALTVKGNTSAHPGHMINASAAWLATEMNISIDSGSTWHGAAAGTSKSGVVTNGQTITLNARQDVLWSDTPATDYSINIEFTATPN